MIRRSPATALMRVLPVVLLFFFAAGVWAQSFTVAASPQSVTIHPGDRNIPVTITVGSSSYTGPITITLSGLPSGITVSPLTLYAGSQGTLTLSAALNADQEAFPATSASDPNQKANTVTLVGVAGSTTASSTMTLMVSLTNPSFAPAQSQINLPIVTINTNGTPILDGTTDVPGTITITSADGSTSYLPNSSDTDNTADFHLHGNSTAAMPKKPYHVKLNTSLDLLHVMGLSCPYITNGKSLPTCDKSKSFDLLANYDDKTFLRDWAASALANAIPIGNGYLSSPANSPSPSGTATLMPWASHSLFVELYLNGVYEGNYQLIEEVKVDSHRINISELAETDITDDISGGYLLEIDTRADEAFTFKTPQGLPIGLIDPDFTPDPEVPQQTSYISSYVDTAENALFASNFTDPALGWRAYFDEASAVNWYIVNDVMGNVDGGDFFSSDYLYKDKDNPLLYMGPIWDFDISSGNVNYHAISNPTIPWVQTQALWYKQWFKDPGFAADAATQWNALKENGVFSNWITSIQQQAATLEQSQANNFGRWPMQGIKVWPNPQAAGSYDNEVAYLANWLNLRIAYLDAQFNHKAQTTTTIGVQSGTLRNGSPAQLSAKVTGGATPTGPVSFMSNGLVIGTAALDDNGNASGAFNLPVGGDALTAVYAGDGNNGLSASNAGNVTVLAPLVESATSLAASVSSAPQGTSVSLPLTVVGTSGSAKPTGSVALTVNGSPLGNVSLSSGTATFTTTALPVGSDVIQANYGGDANYAVSASPTVTVTVAQGNPSVTATPVFSPPAGTYSAAQNVSISDATAGAVIYYTTDNTNPTTSSSVYSSPIAVTATETLKALAVAPGDAASSIATAAYTISSGGGNPPPINYGGGFGSGSGMQANGKARFVSGALELTDGANTEAASSFYAQPISISGFTTTFTLQNTNAQANGLTFVLEDDPSGPKALGPANSALGYSYGPTQSPRITKSVAIKFDLYTTVGSHRDSTGLYTNGAYPGTAGALDMTSSGVVLASGHPLAVSMSYSGTTLSMTITDTIIHAAYSHSWSINIPSSVGASTAYAGFTASTGGLNAVQKVLNWTFTPAGSTGPAATATPVFSPPAGTYSAAQNVSISDATAGAVIYYTTDNTNPTTSSSVYSSPIAVTATETLKALAVAPGDAASSIATAAYTISSGGGNPPPINYGGGFGSGSGMQANGKARFVSGALELTDGANTEAASSFYAQPISISGFTTTFTLQNTNAQANGLTFVLEDDPSGPKALGPANSALGYSYGPTQSPRITKSVAIKFDLYTTVGSHRDSTGLYTNGAYPGTAGALDMTSSGVVLASGHPLAVSMSYSGTTLSMTITDTIIHAAYSHSWSINIPSSVGASTAYAGFTASTGGLNAVQKVLNWTFTPQ